MHSRMHNVFYNTDASIKKNKDPDYDVITAIFDGKSYASKWVYMIFTFG